jgi:hypothetical protein
MTLDAARERLALVVTLLGLASFLTVAPTTSAQSLVALAAITAAVAVVGRCPVVLPYAAPGLLRPRPRAAAVPLVLAGRTTDVVHHPVRPRAPGLV